MTELKTKTEERKKLGRPRKAPGDPTAPYTITPKSRESDRRNARRARELSPVIRDQKALREPNEYNTTVIRTIIESGGLDFEPTDDPRLREAEERFINYINVCAESGMKVGNLMAYNAIGIDHRRILELSTPGARGYRGPQWQVFIQKIRSFCSAFREILMQDGKINPVTGIFWQKNYDGLADKQEVVVTPGQDLGEQTSAEDLHKKYLDSLPDPSDD